MGKAKKTSKKPRDLKSKTVDAKKAGRVKGGATMTTGGMFESMLAYQSLLQKEAAADAALASQRAALAEAAKIGKISL